MKRIPYELYIWIFALIYLAIPGKHHEINLCLLKHFGLWCPGCGLGRSISCILHGDIVGSFKYHYLGLFALIVIVLRIITLIRGVKNG